MITETNSTAIAQPKAEPVLNFVDVTAEVEAVNLAANENPNENNVAPVKKGLSDLFKTLTSPPPPVTETEPATPLNEGAGGNGGNPANIVNPAPVSQGETNWQFQARMQVQGIDMILAMALCFLADNMEIFERFTASKAEIKYMSDMLAEIQEREGTKVNPYWGLGGAILTVYGVKSMDAWRIRKNPDGAGTKEEQRMRQKLEILERQLELVNKTKPAANTNGAEQTQNNNKSNRGSKAGVKRGSYNKNK